MRSSPANASVICVPMEAIYTSGAATRPVKKMYMTKSPSVMRAGQDVAAAQPDHHHADDADDHRGAGGGRRDAGHRLRDVAEQAVRALREHDLLALLGGVALDDADAAQRLGQPAGHLGVDLAALAEERPQRLEGVGHAAAEDAEHDDRDDGEPPVEVEAARPAPMHGRDQTADQLDEPGAHQVADALGVGMTREMSTPVCVESK